jgi:hypothetical protein
MSSYHNIHHASCISRGREHISLLGSFLPGDLDSAGQTRSIGIYTPILHVDRHRAVPGACFYVLRLQRLNLAVLRQSPTSPAHRSGRLVDHRSIVQSR